MLLFKRNYFLLTVILFITEVLIALYVHDSFIRPYFGDYLVVMLVYCAVRSFLNVTVIQASVGTLLFAYTIEILQHLRIVDLLGLAENVIAKTVIGYGFSWWDMLAYTLGVFTIIGVEKICTRGGVF